MLMNIEEFISTLRRKGTRNPAAENTKKAYRMTLEKFARFLDGREATADLAQAFIDHEMKGLKYSSVARYGIAIKRYLTWVGDAVGASRIELPTPKRKLPDYHEKDELEMLLKAARTPLESALVIVLPDTGLRISELLALEEKDIDWERGFIYAHREKTGMEGWVPISNRALSALKDYIRWAKPKGKIFPQGYNQIYIWLKELGAKTGLKVHPHKMRHTAAVLRAMEGQKTTTLADLFGHKRLETTRIYESVKPKELKDEIKPIW